MHRMLNPGTIIGGIRIDAMLGKGAMGEVYRGMQVSLKRPVAVKRIAAHLLRDDEARARFAREAQCVARIQSPHVVAVHDFATVKDDAGEEHTLLVMELVDGGASVRALQTSCGGSFDWRTATAIILHAAEGLAAASEFGVVHRDIKPDNIMVTRKGIAKLADFGLAKSVDSSAMTIAGTVMGTPLYLPPEACRGQPVDARGDLYSLGCTWFHLLTGRPPFQAESTVALLRAHLDDAPPDLRTLAPHIPGGIVDLVHRLLAKHPDERLPSAEALVEAIHGLDGITIPRSIPGIFGAEAATTMTRVADEGELGTSPTAATVLAGNAATIPMSATAATQQTVPVPPVIPTTNKPILPVKAQTSEPSLTRHKKSGLFSLLMIVITGAVILIAALIYTQMLLGSSSVRVNTMSAVSSGDIGLALQRAGRHLAAHPGDADSVNLVREVIAAESAMLIKANRLDDAKRRLTEHRATWTWLDTGKLEREVALAQAVWLAKHHKEKEAVVQFHQLRDQGLDQTIIDQAMVNSLVNSDRPAEAIGAAYRLALAHKGPLTAHELQLLTYALEFEGPTGDYIEKIRLLLRERHPAIVDIVRPWFIAEDFEKRFNAYFILRDAGKISDGEEINFHLQTSVLFSSSYLSMREAVVWLATEISKPNWLTRRNASTLTPFTKVVELSNWNEHADALITVLATGFPDQITPSALTWLSNEDERLRWNAFRILEQAKRLDRFNVDDFHAATLTTFHPLYDSQPFNGALAHFIAIGKTPRLADARKALAAGKKHVDEIIAQYEKSQANGMALRANTCKEQLAKIVKAQQELEVGQ